MAEKLEYTRNWTNEADFPHLSFTKNWENPEDYPTYEPDEVQVRKDMQSLHDEVKDYINDKLIPEILASDATEATRTENENRRIANEEERSSAEAQRVSAENARADRETARVSAEAERSSAETQRADAEAARVAAENARVSAEEARKTAESARNSWEDYDVGKTYAPGNKVYYQGSSYVCLKECIGATPSAGSAWWQLIAHGGDQPQENAMFLFEISRQLPESLSWTGAAYGAGRFVVASGYTSKTVDGSLVRTPGKTIGSGDGENWEYIEFPVKGAWTSIAYGNGMFAAVDYGAAAVMSGTIAISNALTSNKAAYSTDGVSWSAATLPEASLWKDIAYGNGRFVALTSSKVAYSDDAVTWNGAVSLPQPNYYDASYKCLAYGADKFVAVAYKQPTGGSNGVNLGETGPTNVAAYSADGKKWTSIKLPQSGYWSDIAYGNGRFVIVGSTTPLYSDDGVTWTATTAPHAYDKVVFENGRFVAICGGTNSFSAYSDDGITWTETVLPEEKSWKSLVYGNGKFYAFASSDTYATSEDGITWTGDVHEIRNNRGENITDRVKSVLGIS